MQSSPAIDVADNATCTATDLRGIFRPQDGNQDGVSTSDMGAYEGPIAGTTFIDVPLTYWASSYIERLYNAGITGGCGTSPLIYCPGSTVTRAQMAVFLLKGMHGSSYIPPSEGQYWLQ